MKYSFVMPAYKASFIREAIDSILYQTFRDFELIIVDDASPEDIESIVSSYHDPRLIYYKNPNNIGGKDLVSQWNHSISFAKGEYLILASDDDIYNADYLANIDILTNEYPSVNIYRTLLRKIDTMGNVIMEEKPGVGPYLTKNLFLEAFSCGRLYSGIPQYTFKASVLKALGGFVSFPMGWFSDDATATILADKGIAICNKVLFSMRASGINISTMRNSRVAIEKKTEATIAYVDLMSRLTSGDTYLRLVHRAKEIESITLNDASLIRLLLSLRQMHSANPYAFPVRWCCSRILDYLSKTIGYNKYA